MGAPRTTLVLIGLRRSGKTTLGRALAAATGRTFLDTDELLAQRTGRNAGEWLRVEGEAALRAEEAALLRSLVSDASTRSEAVVLATGGGTVLTPGASEWLPNFGRVIWLDISADTAAARAVAADDECERPLLVGSTAVEEARALHAQRAPIYAALAQRRVEVQSDFESALRALLLAAEDPAAPHE